MFCLLHIGECGSILEQLHIYLWFVGLLSMQSTFDSPKPNSVCMSLCQHSRRFFFLKMLQLYVVVAAHWSPGSSSTKAAKCFCPQIQWRLKPFTKTFEDSVDRWTPNMPWTWKFTHSWAQVKLISTYSLWSLTYSTFLLLDGFQGRTVSYGRRFFHFNLWLKCHNLLLLGYTLKSKNKCVVTYGTDQENEFSKMFVIFSWNLNQAGKLTTKSNECT